MFGKLDLIKLTKKRKIVGRGGKSGKSCGRGRGGQLSRAGGRSKVGIFFEGGQMPLSRRLPVRGFSQRNRRIFEIVNLSLLEDNFENQAIIDVLTLKERGFLTTNNPVKILAKGVLTKSFTLKVNAISLSAKKLIEEKGGVISLV